MGLARTRMGNDEILPADPERLGYSESRLTPTRLAFGSLPGMDVGFFNVLSNSTCIEPRLAYRRGSKPGQSRPGSSYTSSA